MSRPLRIAVILLALCHLAAALVPCPRAGASAPHHEGAQLAHADRAVPCHDDGGARSAWLAPRCPCGCGDRAAAPVGQARLGAALFAERVALALPPPSAPPASPAPQLPAPPVAGIDHVPLAA